MGYQATGRLHKVFDADKKSESFTARDFVVEIEDGKFPQMVKFQLVQDKCPLIDDFSEGDEINVDFDLRGREWNEKYFTNLNAWRIALADGSSGDKKDNAAQASARKAPVPPEDDFDDDIPF